MNRALLRWLVIDRPHAVEERLHDVEERLQPLVVASCGGRAAAAAAVGLSEQHSEIRQVRDLTRPYSSEKRVGQVGLTPLVGLNRTELVPDGQGEVGSTKTPRCRVTARMIGWKKARVGAPPPP